MTYQYVGFTVPSSITTIGLSSSSSSSAAPSTVHPREIAKEALARTAAAVIFAHPHPTAVAEPSHADELFTKRLRNSLSLVDVHVRDHLIVAGDDVVSFVEKGLLLWGFRPLPLRSTRVPARAAKLPNPIASGGDAMVISSADWPTLATAQPDSSSQPRTFLRHNCLK